MSKVFVNIGAFEPRSHGILTMAPEGMRPWRIVQDKPE